MLFNSYEFLIFSLCFFAAYYTIPSRKVKLQNILILIASYIFYGWWDVKFLGLIALSTAVDFIAGQGVYLKKEKSKKLWLTLSVVFNIGVLLVFKYFNFFISSFAEGLELLGFQVHITTLQIILPVGISFYTFQTMSYTIDIYRGKLSPTKDFISFATFVSFFPQLVAGPIERASNLLPQILNKREVSKTGIKTGIRLIVTGLFKKIVIADILAVYVNDIWANYETYGGGTLLLGAVFFAFQIYGDFSGYSNIARGLAHLLGIRLMVNFDFPYFASNISEFWQKWHISLSTWFRDYLYIPLGGSRVNKLVSIRNVFIIFLVSGFWHGANWTFTAWGFVHASLFIPGFILKKPKGEMSKVTFWDMFLKFFRIVWTFTLVTLAWVFFRSESISIAIDYLMRINFRDFDFIIGLVPVSLIAVSDLLLRNKINSWLIYVVQLAFIISFLDTSSQEFIYFQF